MSELSEQIAEFLLRLKSGDSFALDEILRLAGGRMMSLALRRFKRFFRNRRYEIHRLRRRIRPAFEKFRI